MKKTLLLEYIYYLAIFLVCIKFYTVRLTFLNFNDNFLVLLFILLFGIKILFQRCSLKEYFFVFLGVCLSFVLCYITGDNSIFYLALAICASKDIDLFKTVKVIFLTNASILLLIVIAYFIQMCIGEVPAILRAGGQIRYTFYFNHPNTFAGTVLWTLLAYTYLAYKKMTYKSYIFLTLIILLVYSFTDSRTFLIMGILSLFLLLVSKIKKTERYISLASKSIFWVCAILMLGLALVYLNFPNNKLIQKLDTLASRRLYFSTESISTYGIQLFPTSIDLTDEFQTETGSLSELHLDSIYSRAFIKEGVLFLVVFGFLLTQTAKYVTKKEQVYLILFAIMGLTERYMLYPSVAFILLFISKFLFQNKRQLNIFTNCTAPAYHAGPKAPRDVIKIIKEHYNAKVITYFSPVNKAQKIVERIRKLYLVFYIYFLEQNISIVQYPFILNKKIMKKLGNGNILLIHDLESIRSNAPDETDVLDAFAYIIVHNICMKDFLIQKGIDKKKIYVLEMFDYCCQNEIPNSCDFSPKKPIVAFAGNLSKKCPFVYQLDAKKMYFVLHLYGVGIDKDINAKELYCGAFDPDILPNKLQANLGLVWDGNYDESDEDQGFKNYTRYNNPHKLSCYLAAGIPVIVWKKSAVAHFVQKHNVGYCISNIYDINNLDFADYNQKQKNALNVGKKIKKGYYTVRVVDQILKEQHYE